MNYTENSCKNIFQTAADLFLNSSIKDQSLPRERKEDSEQAFSLQRNTADQKVRYLIVKLNLDFKGLPVNINTSRTCALVHSQPQIHGQCSMDKC